MKSYVKLYGPPLMKALKALEKVAIGLPEVCIWNTSLAVAPIPGGYDGVSQYFGNVDNLSEKRCSTIISKSGESLGENDFFFEWFRDPTRTELHNLIEKIDEALAPLGVKYSLTTK